MKVVIMAGGLGKRIAEIDSAIPKPLIKIADKPILQWEIECLVRQGLTDIILTVSHMAEKIQDYFKDGSAFGCKIEYFVEKDRLGNAGALFKLWEEKKLSDNFLLLNADSMFDVDFKRFLSFHEEKHDALATLFTHPNNHPYDSTLIVANNETGVIEQWLTKEDERPEFYKNCVNAGLHIINTEMLKLSGLKPESIDADHRVDLDRDVLKPLISTGRIYSYSSPEYVKDMGTPERFEQVTNDIPSEKVQARNLSKKQKAIFLDRDGTINKYVGFLKSIDDFEILPGVTEAIRRINDSKYLCIVVTNQPVIARGDVTVEGLNLIHNKMETVLGKVGAYIDGLYYCPHHPDKGFEGEVAELKIDCECRKPKPGMLLKAAEDFNIDLTKSIMIGDSKTDVEAGKNAGCHTILINTESKDYGQDDTVHFLFDAVEMILNSKQRNIKMLNNEVIAPQIAQYQKACKDEKSTTADLYAILFSIVTFYDCSIKVGFQYNHELKYLLFKTNCVKNPLGFKYSETDYKRDTVIWGKILQDIKFANNPPSDIILDNALKEKVKIDKKLIEDILDMAVYTELLYRMNTLNTARLVKNPICELPLVELLYGLILFEQDQYRLLKEELLKEEKTNLNNPITGVENSVASRTPDYYENIKTSTLDSLESIHEDINEIIRYLYYKHRKDFRDRIEQIDWNLVKPYHNCEFKKLLYTAHQQYMLSRIEESVRYGYRHYLGPIKSKLDTEGHIFGIDNDDRFKAHSIAVHRRYAEREQFTMLYCNSKKEELQTAFDAIEKLAKTVSEISGVLDVPSFHPDKDLFLEAENLYKVKTIAPFTKKFYFSCDIKGVTISQLIDAYAYLLTLAKILHVAGSRNLNDADQSTLKDEIAIVDIAYIANEFARIHGISKDVALKVMDRYIFHEKENSGEDIFAQPLLKVSKTQILLSEILLEHVNLDRVFERQFIRYEINTSAVGYQFEKDFINSLLRGYASGIRARNNRKPIPDLRINTNKVEFVAFDGRNIEFDVILLLGEYLILVELKAIMCSYNYDELENRGENIKKAKEQLERRTEACLIQEDWDKIRKKVSFELPQKPFKSDKIIRIVCSDAFDFTPLKEDDILITDDSTLLKYFTNPYFSVCAVYDDKNCLVEEKLWSKGKPDAEELMQYLMHPVSTQPIYDVMEKVMIPAPVLDEEDIPLYVEDYQLKEDFIANTAKKMVMERKIK